MQVCCACLVVEVLPGTLCSKLSGTVSTFPDPALCKQITCATDTVQSREDTALVQGQMSVLLRPVGSATGSRMAVSRCGALAGGSHLAEGPPATWRTTAQRMQSTWQMRWGTLLIHTIHQPARRYTPQSFAKIYWSTVGPGQTSLRADW